VKEIYSGGSLRIVSGLEENTNSIICDGSSDVEQRFVKIGGVDQWESGERMKPTRSFS
jgi:hypothetical protein